MKHLTFWQNIPSIHQAPLIRSVADLWPGSVTVVADGEVGEERLRQGWRRPHFSPATLVVSPTRPERLSLLSSGVDGVHIFSGFHAYSETWWTLRMAARTGASIGVYAEPVQSHGVGGLMRRVRYSSHAFILGNRLSFLLVTGERGAEWYTSCGFSDSRVFPFAYFVDFPVRTEATYNSKSFQESPRPFGLLFVGQLIHRKGLDLLLDALGASLNFDWRLEVVGSGPNLHEYREQIKRLGLAARVTLSGTISHDEVYRRMARADAIVLPSRRDGWGAVVNEALAVGTPVLVSDSCGAADLVRSPVLGQVFRSGRPSSLASMLAASFATGAPTAADRDTIRSWAKATIAPQIGARYLLDVVSCAIAGGERPMAPWRANPELP